MIILGFWKGFILRFTFGFILWGLAFGCLLSESWVIIAVVWSSRRFFLEINFFFFHRNSHFFFSEGVTNLFASLSLLSLICGLFWNKSALSWRHIPNLCLHIDRRNGNFLLVRGMRLCYGLMTLSLVGKIHKILIQVCPVPRSLVLCLWSSSGFLIISFPVRSLFFKARENGLLYFLLPYNVLLLIGLASWFL